MGTLIKKATFSSPAKINLFLHVNGRREDGYHELQTVFAILNKGDSLDFEVIENSNDIVITPDMGFPVEQNIVYKAINMLKEYTNKNFGIKVNINKKIPMGGGLGGGSSNAATALLAVNLMFNLEIDIDTLASIGRKLGADVPVFVRGRSAFAEGVGEILKPITIKEKYYLVVTPRNTNVSTKEIFTHPDLPRNTPKIDIKDIWADSNHNDCENLVKKCYPNVAKTISWLVKYAPSRMTGTGASCFAAFDNEENALKAFNEMPSDLQGFVAQAINYSPLLQEIQNYTK